MRTSSSNTRSRWLALAGAIVALLALSGCYIEWPQKSCPQYDASTHQWVDRCAK